MARLTLERWQDGYNIVRPEGGVCGFIARRGGWWCAWYGRPNPDTFRTRREALAFCQNLITSLKERPHD